MNHHIIENILSFLPPQEVVKCETVCKEWKEIARRHSLWKSLLKETRRQLHVYYLEEHVTHVFELMKKDYTDAVGCKLNPLNPSKIERFLTLALSHLKIKEALLWRSGIHKTFS